jgi:hypothetical protein
MGTSKGDEKKGKEGVNIIKVLYENKACMKLE